MFSEQSTLMSALRQNIHRTGTVVVTSADVDGPGKILSTNTTSVAVDLLKRRDDIAKGCRSFDVTLHAA